MFDWTRASIASIGFVSAIAAFAVVRTWFVPIGAAPIVPATMLIDSQPAGAALLVDDQPRGATPLTLSIAPGRHTLHVSNGQTERAVEVTVAAGAQVAHYFDLTANAPAVSQGRLSIVTEPPGARVTVDGRARGVSPLVIEDLPAGAHNVAVASELGTAQRTITAVDGVATEVVFALPRSKAPVGGWVTVASPFPVDVIEHNEVVGTSGTAKIMLAAGRHDVILRNESVGYEEPRTIDVVAGSVASIDVVAPNGRLNLNARPWADVLIDGKAVGQTPLANVEVTAGPHQITFRHPQFGERTERVVVAAAGVSRVSVDLSR